MLCAFLATSCGPSPEEKALAERKAENERLKAERMEKAMALRQEVLEHEWDRLFEEKAGTPSEIEIDQTHGIYASIGGVTLKGTAMIDGTKHEFFISFENEGGELVQDQFRVSEWKEYKPKGKGDMHGAWAAMQQFVEKRLKNPSGAKFIGHARDTVTHLGGGRYRVEASVDATNSFGATIRTPFTGIVEDKGDGWELHELNIRE